MIVTGHKTLSTYLSKHKVRPTVLRRSHAPDQEQALAQQVPGQEVQQRVHHRLHDGEDGKDHPVPHPVDAGLPVVVHDGVEGLVGRVDEAHPRPDHESLRRHVGAPEDVFVHFNDGDDGDDGGKGGPYLDSLVLLSLQTKPHWNQEPS